MACRLVDQLSIFLANTKSYGLQLTQNIVKIMIQKICQDLDFMSKLKSL